MTRFALALAALLAALPSAPASAQDESYGANSGLISTRGFVVFFDAEGPLSYATLTPRDVPADAERLGAVRGRSCQLAVSVPIVGSSSTTRLSGAGGRGGFVRAVEDIRARHPGLTGIYDVKVDEHRLSVLTVFSRLCTEVTARGFR